MDDESAVHTTKNRFIRFNPTINTGHIFMAFSVMLASTMAWAQLRTDVNTLLAENATRKAEIAQVAVETHQSVKEVQVALVQWFDKLDNKLDRKKDK